MERDELAAWLRLSLTPGIGNDAARRLLASLGLPQDLFAQGLPAWSQVVSAAQARALAQPPDVLPDQLDATWGWLQAADEGVPRRIVTLGDADYPAGLLQTEDPPILLYALGQLHLLDSLDAGALAIVGSRSPTPQGEIDARQFARYLCESGWCIVSGLAQGVDGAAHDGALSAIDEQAPALRLATVAIIGTGIDRVYPRQHRELAHRIARHGLILSEYPLGTAPLPGNFPKRNRLIAGLSRGTLVVEAALRSGSLITARLASEQGKEVFAIPGSIHNPQSRGPHALIRQGAKLVETAQDILEELHGLSGAALAAMPAAADASDSGSLPADADAAAVLQALGSDPVGLDALQARTGLDTAILQARLLDLELEGQVARLPGGLFQRLARG